VTKRPFRVTTTPYGNSRTMLIPRSSIRVRNSGSRCDTSAGDVIQDHHGPSVSLRPAMQSSTHSPWFLQSTGTRFQSPLVYLWRRICGARRQAEQVPAQQTAFAIRTEQLFLIRPNPDKRPSVLNLTKRFGRAKPKATLWLIV
jgi:hypothetical protein